MLGEKMGAATPFELAVLKLKQAAGCEELGCGIEIVLRRLDPDTARWIPYHLYHSQGGRVFQGNPLQYEAGTLAENARLKDCEKAADMYSSLFAEIEYIHNNPDTSDDEKWDLMTPVLARAAGIPGGLGNIVAVPVDEWVENARLTERLAQAEGLLKKWPRAALDYMDSAEGVKLEEETSAFLRPEQEKVVEYMNEVSAEVSQWPTEKQGLLDSHATGFEKEEKA